MRLTPDVSLVVGDRAKPAAAPYPVAAAPAKLIRTPSGISGASRATIPKAVEQQIRVSGVSAWSVSAVEKGLEFLSEEFIAKS